MIGTRWKRLARPNPRLALAALGCSVLVAVVAWQGPTPRPYGSPEPADAARSSSTTPRVVTGRDARLAGDRPATRDHRRAGVVLGSFDVSVRDAGGDRVTARWHATGPGGDELVGRAGEDGRARAGGLALGTWRLRVGTSDTFTAATTIALTRAAPHAAPTVMLETARTVEVRLTTPEGRPLLSELARDSDLPPTWLRVRRLAADLPSPCAGNARGLRAPSPTALHDARTGRWGFIAVPAGRADTLSLELGDVEVARIRVPAGVEVVHGVVATDRVLAAVAAVSIEVEDADGAPVHRAAIALSQRGRALHLGRTDDFGRVTFAQCPPGALELVVQHAEHPTLHTTVVARPGATDERRTVRLPRKSAAEIVVLEPQAAP